MTPTSDVRLRFAPSPTGNVHIGNIRAAIFNWLYARHVGGAFLLRVEDTDRERSTDEAIANLLDAMAWMGLDYDEEPLYQSTRREAHLAAADKLLADGWAYHDTKGGDAEAVVFRIPWNAEEVPGVTTVGPVELDIHSDEPVVVDPSGIGYALVSKKDKPVPQKCCLAGMRDLVVEDGSGTCLFRLNERIDDVLAGESIEVCGGAKLRFTRRRIAFTDLVKGELTKPLDSLRDVVIVRSDGSPVFHLANVCDDLFQGVSHIVRGDDHVENTYRHLFMIHALGGTPPQYAHLPMIVNDQGKPYSKRDGDAYVGDFRTKGYLAEALFNYLTLLGWSPGDDREKLSRNELVELFSLDRVQQSAARMDFAKLDNLNGQYLAELPPEEFIRLCRQTADDTDFANAIDDEAYFTNIAHLLQSRTKKFTDVADWDYFFVELPEYDEKACRKFLQKPGIPEALTDLREALATTEFDVESLEKTILEVTDKHGIAPGKLNQPVRVAVTGKTVGAGVYETLELLGQARTLKRLDHALTLEE